MNKLLSLINKLIILFLIGFVVYEVVFLSSSMSFTKLLTVLCIIPIVVLPYILEKIVKCRISETLKLIYYSFTVISLVLGSIMELYYKIWWFDLFVHFLSGLFTAFVSLIILKKKDLIKKENLLFNIIFILAITLTIASFWEFLEFFSDRLFGGDSQWVIKTGVDDTMTDMLIAFLGGIIFSIYFFIRMKMDSSKLIKDLKKVF